MAFTPHRKPKMLSLQFVMLVVLSSLSPSNGYAGIYGDECSVELSQKTSLACQRKRYQQLLAKRQLFQLAPLPGLENEPIRLLNMTVDQQPSRRFVWENLDRGREYRPNTVRFVLKTEVKILPYRPTKLAVFNSSRYPFELWELYIYLTKTKGGAIIFDKWAKLNAGEDIQSFADFVKIYAFFRKAQAAFGDPYFKNPSDEEPFQDVITYWMSDKVFAEQRLAGANPVTLQRVTTDREKVGIKWTELKKILNQEFDWDNLIINTPNMPNVPLERAIATRMVFVLRYPLLDYLPAMPDLLESRPGRKMWDPTSPIAFFAVNPYKRSELVPIAIQMDVRPGSPVYTPKDNDLWMIAKLSVQGADLGYNQVAEHLAKTHLLMEPFCVSKDRQLSERHPLHQIIKYHCRGISITDKLAFKILLGVNGSLHKIFPYGYRGAVSIGLRSFRQTSWKDTDFLGNIQKRGVERRSLHYFPYRDDGYLLYSYIQRAVREYVEVYYECDEEVADDFELQSYMNEVSADGIGSDGGLGNIRDLPAELTSKTSLVIFLTRFLYHISVHHAAINYPLTDYGAFTLNMPTKLYRDSRVADDVFSLFNFPNANISAEQGLIAMSLSNYRFDTLFDYGSQLPDKPGRIVISKWFNFLHRSVQPYIERRNQDRLAKGHLTYPYLIPRWIPNGIQT